MHITTYVKPSEHHRFELDIQHTSSLSKEFILYETGIVANAHETLLGW